MEHAGMRPVAVISMGLSMEAHKEIFAYVQEALVKGGTAALN